MFTISPIRCLVNCKYKVIYEAGRGDGSLAYRRKFVYTYIIQKISDIRLRAVYLQLQQCNRKGKTMKNRKKRGDLLLVVDMQNVYLEGQPWACIRTREAADHICEVLKAGTADQVIFTRFLENPEAEGTWREYNRTNREINHNPWMNELMEVLLPWTEQWPVYDKSTYSSFAVPEVAAAAEKAERVVIAGVVAECCILSTLLAGIDLGHKIIYLRDAVSGQSEELEKEIADLADKFAPVHTEVMTVGEYLRKKGEDFCDLHSQ